MFSVLFSTKSYVLFPKENFQVCHTPVNSGDISQQIYMSDGSTKQKTQGF